MGVKMNLRVKTKSHATYPEIVFLTKSISKRYGRATAMPRALELISSKIFKLLFQSIWFLCTLKIQVYFSITNVFLRSQVGTPRFCSFEIFVILDFIEFLRRALAKVRTTKNENFINLNILFSMSLTDTIWAKITCYSSLLISFDIRINLIQYENRKVEVYYLKILIFI